MFMITYFIFAMLQVFAASIDYNVYSMYSTHNIYDLLCHGLNLCDNDFMVSLIIRFTCLIKQG